MPDGRWQTIQNLFHQALQLSPADRGPFLAGACGGDDDLQREIDSLLGSTDKAEDFIDQVVGTAAADLLDLTDTSTAPSLTGQTLGQYCVGEFIGSAGM